MTDKDPNHYYDCRVWNTKKTREATTLTENPNSGAEEKEFSLFLRVKPLPYHKKRKKQIRRYIYPFSPLRKSWAAKIPPHLKEPFSRIGNGDWVVSPFAFHFVVQETPGNAELILPDEWIATCDLLEKLPGKESYLLIFYGEVCPKEPSPS